MYLLDTNVLILAIDKKEPDYSFLKQIILKDKLYLSVISISEFLSRATEGEEEEIEELMNSFPILLIDLAIAKLAAEYRKKSLKKGRGELLDCFIAAQAKLHNLTLVTNNKPDFPMKDIKVIAP